MDSFGLNHCSVGAVLSTGRAMRVCMVVASNENHGFVEVASVLWIGGPIEDGRSIPDSSPSEGFVKDPRPLTL